MRLPPLLTLRVFEVVSRHASIRRAAEELRIDHSAVSRHLKALQTDVDSVLLRTSHSGIELTEAGARYATQIRKALIEISTATAELSRGRRPGRLTVWSKPGFAALFLAPRLALFERLHPNIDIVLRPSENEPDFQSREADLQIGFRPSAAPNVRQIELCRPRIIPVANPDWLAAQPRPRQLADLLRLRLINTEADCWRDWLAERGMSGPLDIKGPTVWNIQFALEAAKSGQGVALANELLVEGLINDGVLEELDLALPPSPRHPYMLIARKDLWGDPAVTSFRRWLTGLLADRLGRVPLRTLVR
jgi:DNA-binding transcriptional LysR family regulator